MKLNINFLQTGGVPLTNDLMSDIMEAIKFYDVLGDLAGHLTILSGCLITGSNVSPGVVAINGEILYFEGGSIVSTVYIHTEQIPKTFQDQTDKILIEKKIVKFGSGAVSYNWDDFFRLKTLEEIQTRAFKSASQSDLDAIKQDVELLKLKTAPIVNGGIAWAWFKPLNEIPAGWKECTDIRGKVIVGLDPNDPDFLNLKSTLGTKTHTLTKPELPDFGLSFQLGLEKVGTGNRNALSRQGGNEYTQWISSGGSNQPHNNIQPSIIAYFIEPNLP
ncbi:hypothetical protein OK18_19045 [Chryseobacterium gallinarum]|uniref:Baseplate structural protein Gp10 C-terminal domain-containing protein n=1 Tax=Chryseobacterium gallinarum TaxID=1324352 RepID=A0A0G3M6A1_CHRGL|nr:hypothetical protein [Chryseobacterium gallinarum]AKK74429.1 hypothetical protein OK18_19045 [Chryseobacterium gallinarum]